MRILQCCLSNFYIDNFSYQENILPSINKLDGHEVKIIASTETFDINSNYIYVNPGKYVTKDGIELIRIPYKKYLPHFIMKKIRHYKNVYNLIKEFSPDVILFHGAAAYEILTVAKYKKDFPNVKFYVDSHADRHNSGKNWISKFFLHKFFYRLVLKKAMRYIDKVFCITYETIEFVKSHYKVPQYLIEDFPLGGFILSDAERLEKRLRVRETLNLNEDDILMIHSGKMDVLKRTTEILNAFSQINGDKLKLVLIGSIHNNIKDKVEELISLDKRIIYLGWLNSHDLIDYLCACDLYVQPGGQSVTMQNSICCGSAAALYPHKSHKYLLGDSVFYIDSVEDMKELFQKINEDKQILEEKRTLSYEIAKNKLNYRVLAARIYR